MRLTSQRHVDPVAGHCLDISDGGIQIETPLLAETGALLRLSIHLEPFRSADALAEVMYADGGTLGLRWLEIPTELQQAIRHRLKLVFPPPGENRR